VNSENLISPEINLLTSTEDGLRHNPSHSSQRLSTDDFLHKLKKGKLEKKDKKRNKFFNFVTIFLIFALLFIWTLDFLSSQNVDFFWSLLNTKIGNLIGSKLNCEKVSKCGYLKFCAEKCLTQDHSIQIEHFDLSLLSGKSEVKNWTLYKLPKRKSKLVRFPRIPKQIREISLINGNIEMLKDFGSEASQWKSIQLKRYSPFGQAWLLSGKNQNKAIQLSGKIGDFSGVKADINNLNFFNDLSSLIQIPSSNLSTKKNQLVGPTLCSKVSGLIEIKSKSFAQSTVEVNVNNLLFENNRLSPTAKTSFTANTKASAWGSSISSLSRLTNIEFNGKLKFDELMKQLIEANSLNLHFGLIHIYSSNPLSQSRNLNIETSMTTLDKNVSHLTLEPLELSKVRNEINSLLPLMLKSINPELARNIQISKIKGLISGDFFINLTGREKSRLNFQIKDLKPFFQNSPNPIGSINSQITLGQSPNKTPQKGFKLLSAFGNIRGLNLVWLNQLLYSQNLGNTNQVFLIKKGVADGDFNYQHEDGLKAKIQLNSLDGIEPKSNILFENLSGNIIINNNQIRTQIKGYFRETNLISENPENIASTFSLLQNESQIDQKKTFPEDKKQYLKNEQYYKKEFAYKKTSERINPLSHEFSLDSDLVFNSPTTDFKISKQVSTHTAKGLQGNIHLKSPSLNLAHLKKALEKVLFEGNTQKRNTLVINRINSVTGTLKNVDLLLNLQSNNSDLKLQSLNFESANVEIRLKDKNIESLIIPTGQIQYFDDQRILVNHLIIKPKGLNNQKSNTQIELNGVLGNKSSENTSTSLFQGFRLQPIDLNTRGEIDLIYIQNLIESLGSPNISVQNTQQKDNSILSSWTDLKGNISFNTRVVNSTINNFNLIANKVAGIYQDHSANNGKKYPLSDLNGAINLDRQTNKINFQDISFKYGNQSRIALGGEIQIPPELTKLSNKFSNKSNKKQVLKSFLPSVLPQMNIEMNGEFYAADFLNDKLKKALKIDIPHDAFIPLKLKINSPKSGEGISDRLLIDLHSDISSLDNTKLINVKSNWLSEEQDKDLPSYLIAQGEINTKTKYFDFTRLETSINGLNIGAELKGLPDNFSLKAYTDPIIDLSKLFKSKRNDFLVKGSLSGWISADRINLFDRRSFWNNLKFSLKTEEFDTVTVGFAELESLEAYGETKDGKGFSTLIVNKGRVKNLAFEDLNSSFKLKGNNLTLSGLSLNTAGGEFSMKGNIDLLTALGHFDGKANKVSVGSISRGISGLKGFNGIGDFDFAVDGYISSLLEGEKPVYSSGRFDLKSGNVSRVFSLQKKLNLANLVFGGPLALNLNAFLEVMAPNEQGAYKSLTGKWEFNENWIFIPEAKYKGLNKLDLNTSGLVNRKTNEIDFYFTGSLPRTPVRINSHGQVSEISNAFSQLNFNNILGQIPLFSRVFDARPRVFQFIMRGEMNDQVALNNSSTNTFKWLNSGLYDHLPLPSLERPHMYNPNENRVKRN
jgi:hypothetical protein